MRHSPSDALQLQVLGASRAYRLPPSCLGVWLEEIVAMTHNVVQSVYGLLPPPVADVALSLFGVRNMSRLRRWNRIVAATALTENWTDEEQCYYVASRLRWLLRHALDFVPRYEAYRGLKKELGASDQQVFSLVRELPVVSKEEILSEPEAFVSRRVPLARCVVTHTSGTTGTPMAVRVTRRAILVSDALWWRRTVWAGYQPGDTVARLVGDPAVPLRGPWSRFPVRRSWTDRRLYLSSFHLDERSALLMRRSVQRARPSFVMGYPSALCAWAGLVDGPISTDTWAPRAVLYSSEPLYSHQHDTLAAAFGAPLRGLYGCAERVLSAAECSEGALHLSLLDGYLEGQFRFEDAPEGPYVSGLLNEAMPLLRYDLGDTLSIQGRGRCVCGRTLPTLNPVLTKQEDALLTPSGRWIPSSSLTWAFKHLDGLRRSQVIQRTATDIEVLLDIDQHRYRIVAGALKRQLERLTCGEMVIRLTRTSDVPVTRVGKTRFVVNEFASEVCLSAGGRQHTGNHSRG